MSAREWRSDWRARGFGSSGTGCLRDFLARIPRRDYHQLRQLLHADNRRAFEAELGPDWQTGRGASARTARGTAAVSRLGYG